MVNLLYLYGDTFFSSYDELFSYIIDNELDEHAVGEKIEVWKMKMPNYESFFKNNDSYKNMLEEFNQWMRHLGGEDYINDDYLESKLSHEVVDPLVTSVFKNIMQDNILLEDEKLYDVTISKEMIMEYV